MVKYGLFRLGITMSEAEVAYYDLNEIWYDLGYQNRRGAVRAIRKKSFPLPYYTIAGRKVVDRLVFHTYFRKQREEGLKAMGYKLTDQ